MNSADVSLVSAVFIGELAEVATSATMIAQIGTLLVALSAVDVIHAIAIPTIGVKADAIPGRCALVRINAHNSGILHGQCSELCGSMHGFMPLSLTVPVARVKISQECRFLVLGEV